MTRPRAPKHLCPKTRRWWSSVVNEWQLEDHHKKLLTLAAESWDRIAEAQEQITIDGVYIKDRFGQLKPHPALAVERQEKICFARLLRELDLDVDPPPESRRPAKLRRYK